VFESIEAYSPLWTAEEENEFRITEPTLQKELRIQIVSLEAYVTEHSPTG
jgi:flagellar biosynthesis regulator FlaF